MRPLRSGIASLLLLLLGNILPVAVAQDSSLIDLASQVTPCVIQCFTADLFGPNPSCNATDTACLCTNKKLAADVGSCLLANCTLSDSLKAANASAGVCNYESDNKQVELEVIFTVMMALSFIFVLIRLYVRLFIQTDSALGIDDWITGFNLFAWSGYSLSVLISAIPEGLGKDDWELTTQNVSMLSLHSFVGQIMYSIVNASIKLALLFFYLRIFPDRKIRRLLLGTVAAIVCYALAFTIASVFLCKPVAYFWTQWSDEASQGTCIDYLAPSYAYAGFGIFLDLFIMAIPLSQLRKLKMGWRKKINVGLMFSVGIVIVAVSVARFVTLLRFSFTSGFSTSWAAAQIYTTIEVNVGIICTCFPSLRVLLVHFFPTLKGTVTTQSGALYDNKYSKGGSRAFSNRKMGSNLAGGSTLTATAVSATDKGQQYDVEQTDAIYVSRDYAVELTQLPASPKMTDGSNESIPLNPTVTNNTGRSQGTSWLNDDVERRPVSKEQFI